MVVSVEWKSRYSDVGAWTCLLHQSIAISIIGHQFGSSSNKLNVIRASWVQSRVRSINIVCGQLQLPKSINEETTIVNRRQTMIIN